MNSSKDSEKGKVMSEEIPEYDPKLEKHKGGRPTKYDPEFVNIAYRMCERGFVDKDIAHVLDVSESTINLWKQEYPEFSESIKSGKKEYDEAVVRCLRHRAIGYSHPDEKIFTYEGEIIRAETTKYYPPETAACIYWLNNRQPDKWSNKHHITVDSGHAEMLQEAINRVKAAKGVIGSDDGEYE